MMYEFGDVRIHIQYVPGYNWFELTYFKTKDGKSYQRLPDGRYKLAYDPTRSAPLEPTMLLPFTDAFDRETIHGH